jgi:hypothetical protein
MEATMAHPEERIEKSAARLERGEIVSQLTPDRNTRPTNELQAAEIRQRIKILNQRLAKLTPAPPK